MGDTDERRVWAAAKTRISMRSSGGALNRAVRGGHECGKNLVNSVRGDRRDTWTCWLEVLNHRRREDWSVLVDLHDLTKHLLDECHTFDEVGRILLEDRSLVEPVASVDDLEVLDLLEVPEHLSIVFALRNENATGPGVVSIQRFELDPHILLEPAKLTFDLASLLPNILEVADNTVNALVDSVSVIIDTIRSFVKPSQFSNLLLRRLEVLLDLVRAGLGTAHSLFHEVSVLMEVVI